MKGIPVTEIINEPNVVVSATIDAPEIAAEQAAFQAENPSLFVMTVNDYNDVLKEVGEVVLEQLKTADDIQAGVASYHGDMSYVSDGGISVTISVHCDGFEGALLAGSELFGVLAGMVDIMVGELLSDPLSEHRREHVAELMLQAREANQDDPDFDEKSLLDQYNNAPLDELCSVSRMRKVKSALSDFFVEHNVSLSPSEEPRARSFWSRVKSFFVG